MARIVIRACLGAAATRPTTVQAPYPRRFITEKRLNGKVAIITGAGTGIGEAIAPKFAKEGAVVVVNGPPGDPGDGGITIGKGPVGKETPRELREEPKGELHDLAHTHEGLEVLPAGSRR